MIKYNNYIDDAIKEMAFMDIDKAIDFAGFLGKFISGNQIPYFNSSGIEKELIDRFVNERGVENIEIKKKDSILFVATEMYLMGGHTRLMENLALMLDGDCELLATRKVGGEVKERIADYFNRVHECCRGNLSATDYITSIAEKLAGHDKLILNIHPEDIYTVIACGLSKEINIEQRVFFVNHADHVFVYGSYISDCWFEISLYGKNIDKLRYLTCDKSFLGIPIRKDDREFLREVDYSGIKTALTFITAGSSWKFKVEEHDKKLMSVIEKILLRNNEIKFYAIGVNAFLDYWWWFLKLKFLFRLKLIKAIPHDEYMAITKKSDCYIDSYPAPGGTAFVEQFLNGAPCIGLCSRYFGYTPLDKVKRNSVEDVLDMLDYPPDENTINSIKKEIFEVHAFSKVKDRFLDCVLNGRLSNNLLENYLDNQEMVFKRRRIFIGYRAFLYIRNNKMVIRKIINGFSFFEKFEIFMLILMYTGIYYFKNLSGSDRQ